MIQAGKINRKRQTPGSAQMEKRETALSALFAEFPIDYVAVRRTESKHAAALGHDPCWTREGDFEQ